MKTFFNKNKVLKIALITYLIAIFPFGFVKTEYYFMSPGPPYQWEIEIKDQKIYDFDGNLYQLTVRRDEANYFVYAWANLNSQIDLYPREVILPDGVTPQELSEISIQNMITSENVAIAVALETLGYDVESEGDGVLVVGLLDDSPVKDKLYKNDLITSINNQIVKSSTEFISLLKTYDIGDIVEIGLVRNEEDITIKTTLIEHVEYENEPMVGFLASTPNQKFVYPFEVDINTGNVGGPSAGMMMALNVYNLLTENDITAGNKIAGTGTIEIDGSVGPVGGVKQKVIAAKRANASLILVPTANYLEASVFSDENTFIVAVDSFEEALDVISDFSSR
ncbi:PDZ domain-containing protein [Candidatus Actinomarina sp. HD9-500m-PIT-SAG01]|nr:PDZ domain-containing protein [Candidatus Actinomarina sp. HD9-500m-PIT-SAG01]